jgi:4-hydroxy-tetrahydrodipicolinate synthase
MIQQFEQGQIQSATQLHLDLFPLFKALFLATNPIPVKAALTLQGWQVGTPRLPLTEPSESVIEALQATMRPLGLLSA